MWSKTGLKGIWENKKKIYSLGIVNKTKWKITGQHPIQSKRESS